MNWSALFRWLWNAMQYRTATEPLPPLRPWEVRAPWDRRPRRRPSRLWGR